jgi:hypothetical protein
LPLRFCLPLTSNRRVKTKSRQRWRIAKYLVARVRRAAGRR